jgi:polysaccharide export outer membrane protein
MSGFRLAILFLSAWMGGCSTSSEVSALNPLPLDVFLSKSAPMTSVGYLIGIGDDITVRLYNHPELDEDVRIRPDGKILLSVIGEITAAGKTPEQLSRALTADYGKSFQKSETFVIVRHFNSMRAFVAGEVAHPGIVDMQDGHKTVVQAIAAVGGITDNATLKAVVLIRRQSDQPEPMITQLDLQAALGGSNFREDVVLYPNDVVYVPRSNLAEMNLAVHQLLLNNFNLTTTGGVYKTLP